MKRLAATFLILALCACDSGPSSPVAAPAGKAAVDIETIVSTQTVTASISASHRGTWLTDSGLGVAVSGGLKIDRLDWYYYNGAGRLQLRRGGSGSFADHWSSGEQGVRMILNIGGTKVELSPLATKAWWSNWKLKDHSQFSVIEGLDTGDTFSIKIEKCPYTNYGECSAPAAAPTTSLSDGAFKLTFADREGISAVADPGWFTFRSDHDGRTFGTYSVSGNTLTQRFDPPLTASSYVHLSCESGCVTFTDGSFSRAFRVSLGTRSGSTYAVVPDTAEVVTPEPEPEPEPATVTQASFSGKLLFLTFSKTLDDEATVTASHFTVSSANAAGSWTLNSVSAVSVVGNLAYLTMAYDLGCQVSYRYTGRGGLEDSDGETVAAFRGTIDECE